MSKPRKHRKKLFHSNKILQQSRINHSFKIEQLPHTNESKTTVKRCETCWTYSVQKWNQCKYCNQEGLGLSKNYKHIANDEIKRIPLIDTLRQDIEYITRRDFDQIKISSTFNLLYIAEHLQIDFNVFILILHQLYQLMNKEFKNYHHFLQNRSKLMTILEKVKKCEESNHLKRFYPVVWKNFMQDIATQLKKYIHN